MYKFALYLYIYSCMTKDFRHKSIKEIISTNEISSQETLLNILIDRGFDITQATLSRDIKELKIVKTHTAKGSYAYQLPETIGRQVQAEQSGQLSAYGFVSIEFSGQLAVIKTRPGYAMAIAGEIDANAKDTILGTVAGDDTILIIPRENIERNDVIKSLSTFIPTIQ